MSSLAGRRVAGPSPAPFVEAAGPTSNTVKVWGGLDLQLSPATFHGLETFLRHLGHKGEPPPDVVTSLKARARHAPLCRSTNFLDAST